MFAIYKREMRAYFVSPIGYIFIAAFLAVNAFLFSYYTIQAAGNGGSPSISEYFTILLLILTVLIPLLTMKLFADERKMKTEQLLLTSPVTISGMVMAKFLAAYTMFAGTFLASCFNFYLLFEYGTPNVAMLISYVIGVLLLGGVFVAVGIFISSLTENQLVAAIGTIVLLLFMLMINFLNEYINSYVIRSVLNWISIYGRFSNFTYGILDIGSLVYYASVMAAFIFLTVRVYEKRRWD